MSQNKVCPHCGSKMFLGSITRGCALESIVDEQGNNTFRIVKESSGDKYELSVLQCCRCRAEINEDDLIEGVICKECKKVVNPNELNEEGICEVCQAKREHTELATASTDDLIKMLIEERKRADSLATKINAKLEKADEAEAKATAKTAKAKAKDEATNDTADDKQQEAKPVKKGGAKRGKVKMGEATESTNNEEVKSDVETAEQGTTDAEKEEVSQTEVNDAVNDIANQQDAPFPELPYEEPLPMNPPVEEVPVQQEVQPVQNPSDGFQMFDDSDSYKF